MPLIGGNSILGCDFQITSSCFLEKLEHCKADISPKCEFLKTFFTLHLNGKAYKMGMIVDHRPTENIDIKTNDASALLPIVSPCFLSLSLSPSAEHLQAALGKGGKLIAADDHVTIPKFDLREDINDLSRKEFSSFITLNTLTIGRCSTHIWLSLDAIPSRD